MQVNPGNIPVNPVIEEQGIFETCTSFFTPAILTLTTIYSSYQTIKAAYDIVKLPQVIVPLSFSNIAFGLYTVAYGVALAAATVFLFILTLASINHLFNPESSDEEQEEAIPPQPLGNNRVPNSAHPSNVVSSDDPQDSEIPSTQIAAEKNAECEINVDEQTDVQIINPQSASYSYESFKEECDSKFQEILNVGIRGHIEQDILVYYVSIEEMMRLKDCLNDLPCKYSLHPGALLMINGVPTQTSPSIIFHLQSLNAEQKMADLLESLQAHPRGAEIIHSLMENPQIFELFKDSE